ncbi:MAG: hypothetical protein KC994_15745 [Candidatus Omnitrophica bacterium]|nr:hypothetical protein [Candidatus Omnitrophota bacterium]
MGCTDRFRYIPGYDFGDSNEGLHLIDISDPREPVLLSPSPLLERRNTSHSYGGVDEISLVEGGTFFGGNWSDNEYHVGTVDFSNEQPWEVEIPCGWATDCFYSFCSFRTADLATSGTRTVRVELYRGRYEDVPSSDSEVCLCSVPDDPCDCFRSAFRTENQQVLTGVDIIGDIVFLSGSTRSDLPTGLHIFRIVGEKLIPISSIETGGTAEKVKVVDNYAFVADGDNGLTVVDWFDPYCPKVVGRVDTPGRAINLALAKRQEDVVVSMGESGVALVGIEYPWAPTLDDSFDTPGYARSAQVEGRYIYVADGNEGLLVLRSRSSYPRTESPSPPTFEPPCDLDVRPGWGDGLTDSHDLLGWMDRIRKDEVDSQNLFVFARDWKRVTE